MTNVRGRALLRGGLTVALLASALSTAGVAAEGDDDSQAQNTEETRHYEGNTLVIHGGNHSTVNTIDLAADGATGTADGSGGDENTATTGDPAPIAAVDASAAEAQPLPVGDAQVVGDATGGEAAAGNGGDAVADASGGTLYAPANADGSAPVTINTGGNSGSTINVGDVYAGDGTTVVEIYGGDTAVRTDVAMSVNGGNATADASGGDRNFAAVLAPAEVAVSGGTAAAGNGGGASAFATGGIAPVGQILGGNNEGATISVGDIYGGTTDGTGQAGDVRVRIDGGTLSATTITSGLGADGGLASADGSGGNDNVALVGGAGGGAEATDQVTSAQGVPGDESVPVADDAPTGIGQVAANDDAGGSVSGAGGADLISVIGGNNVGAQISLGDIAGGSGTSGGAGGDVAVDVYGGDIAAYAASEGGPAYGGENSGAVITAGDVIAGDGSWGGAGGDASLALDGGSIDAFAAAPAGAFAGGNEGGRIRVGDTIGGDGISGQGGGALLAVEGSDISASGIGLEVEAPFDPGDPAADLPWDGPGAAAGVGGTAAAEADAGSVSTGAVFAGENRGIDVTVGDVIGGDGIGGRGGDATVDIAATDIATSFAINAAVDGGAAGASALGGADNNAVAPDNGLFPAGGAAAGSGGFAGAAANGGRIEVGDIHVGGNDGGEINVGDVYGGHGFDGGRGGDATVALDGGSITAAVLLNLQANGGVANATADGGVGNSALLVGDAAADLGAYAGTGGLALAEANGGTITIGDVLVGGNQGAVMAVGDVVGGGAADGGRGGDATLTVNGTNITSVIQLDLQANGGSAFASANGGDGNSALFDATDAAQLTGLDLLAGVGGIAQAQANGGRIVVGDLLAGENVGTVVAFGEIAGGDAWEGGRGESAVFMRDGGSIVALTQIAAAANGGNAIAVADGGDGNVVLLVADATTTLGDLPRAGNGGSVLSQANGGPVTIGNITSGQNLGTSFLGPESARAEKDNRKKVPLAQSKTEKAAAGKPDSAKQMMAKPGAAKTVSGGSSGRGKAAVVSGSQAGKVGKGGAAKSVKRLPSTGAGVAAEQDANGGLLLALALAVAAAGALFRRRLDAKINRKR